jgi:hypothetical protein
MNAAIWNHLHDGVIESIEGVVPGDLRLAIGIEYLCGRLPTSANHLVVRLRGCTLLEFVPFGAVATVDRSSIVDAEVEILSASWAADAIEVMCSAGVLRVRYEREDVELVEGVSVSPVELQLAAEGYWIAWDERRPGHSP